MNFLQVLKAKTEKIQTIEMVKLGCFIMENADCVISKTGYIVNSDDIIKIENGYVYMTGNNAFAYSKQEALAQVKL